jgi:hypothetical protein
MALGVSLVAAALVLAAPAAPRANDLRTNDSRLLVFNESIGDVWLGMRRWQVELLYGAAGRQKVFRRYFPVGTRYEGKRLVRVTYRFHGGTLVIQYVEDQVKTIQTTSSYYRTAHGVGVGTVLPHDRCMRLDEIGHTGPRGCKNRWRGFVFDGECGNAWLTEGRGTMTALYMRLSREIRVVQLGDPDVILYCF